MRCLRKETSFVKLQVKYHEKCHLEYKLLESTSRERLSDQVSADYKLRDSRCPIEKNFNKKQAKVGRVSYKSNFSGNTVADIGS